MIGTEPSPDFDVTAMARESLGIDATSPRTRDDFATLLRGLLER